ncbi:NUDIX domain-containing protein [Kitasatospora sp. NPDC093550]|uniref:NUDIX domain-containing protein n=1 Tax=Kitasatospora sp. NPDC093550 TaxID=3364089 RepID=UPI003807536C
MTETVTETETDWGSERPWLTADIVVIRTDDRVLLIQRADEPHKGSWALPGGYVDQGERCDRAAARELEEETGIVAMPEELVQVNAYTDPDRDPRGRVVTVSYLLEVASGVTAVAGDDAATAEWHPLDKLPPLAFDHAQILADAVRALATKEG